jgi:hypothetical protein
MTTTASVIFAREDLHAVVTTSIRDAALATKITTSISEALDQIATPQPARVVKLRTHKRLRDLRERDATAFVDAIAVIRVTASNARRLPALVEKIRSMNPRGVQLVWDGEDPPRDAIEENIFAILEHARATPTDPPVILHTNDVPALALCFLVSSRAEVEVETKGRASGRSHV